MKQKKRSFYRVCEYCGCNLDPCEKCDCREAEKAEKPVKVVFTIKPKIKGGIAV